MRPLSDVARALLSTACRLSAAGRAVTLAEMAAGACVGHEAATYTVKNLRRSGRLRIVGLRRVDYRNRPVAVYEPVLAADLAAGAPELLGAAVLCNCMATWARQP